MPNTTVCPLAKKCGGCQLQNLSYPEQLHLKQATAIRLLGRFGHVEEILGMADPYHYRNKVQAAFGVNRQGQIISGVYQSASHRIVPVSDCLIEDKVADRIIVTIRKLLKSFKIRPYDEDTGRGTLRHVLVRRGRRSGEILVVLVTAHGMLPGKRNFVRALLQQHPDITTVVQNINAGQTSLVLGVHSEVLYGPGYIREQLGDFTFRISPRAFYQINPVQTEVLYRTALEYAGLTGTETVVDAYCGTGTIGIFASRDAARVIGVENNRDAVRDAISNAKANRADNVRFYTADASDFLQGMARAGEHADVVILDPPRAGVDEPVIDVILRAAPERIVYVSCNPATLARDLELLTRKGYKVESSTPVDMFPHSEHIETVCALSKLDIYQKITVNLKMDELDVTAAETKATYEEIREYVKEHTGLNVSNLYIAQVKRKCGIKEWQNYNKPKAENPKQLKCPPEKEKAIREALKYFKMI